jgi:hypothetical protein
VTAFRIINEWLLFFVLLIIPWWMAFMLPKEWMIVLLWFGYVHTAGRLSQWASRGGSGSPGTVHHKEKEQAIGEFIRWAVEDQRVAEANWNGIIQVHNSNRKLKYELDLNITDVPDAADNGRTVDSGEH